MTTHIKTPDLEGLGLNYQEFRIAVHLYRRRQDGILPGSAKEIAGHCGVSLATARTALAALVNRGMASVATFSGNDAAVLLQKKSPGGFPSPCLEKCAWCAYAGPSMHRHHYPVSAADGGTETIAICPSCHSEFHALTDQPLYEAVEAR